MKHMPAQGSLHSMSFEDRALALEVLAEAWALLASSGSAGQPASAEHVIVAALGAAAATLPAAHPRVTPDYASYLVEAAVWYLDRAVRRVVDPERDGLTALQRTATLDWFGSTADVPGLERLFAMAAALNADDA